MARIHSKASNLARAVAGWWGAFTQDLFSPYRPERHYMRGPGPKWRAKQAQG